MGGSLICPLTDLKRMRNLASMGLHQVKEIEQHISTGNCPHPSLKEFFFQGALEGTTPLLLACHYGKLDSVKHIVESWKVDVNAAAAYFSDPMNYSLFNKPKNVVLPQIEKATPLLVAAGNGHNDIVRYLVQNGADIFAKSSNKANLKYDGLTPLHGAVCDLRSLGGKEPRYRKSRDRAIIARYFLKLGADPCVLPSDGYPIWMQPMCGVDVLKELLNHGIDFLNQCHPNHGWTILHHWVHLPGYCTENESLAAVNLLLEKGPESLLHVQDAEGFTPLLESVKIIETIALGETKARAKFSVLDVLLERSDIFPMEKIEAMELAGSVLIVSGAYYAPYYQKAFEYWRRAQQLGQLESNGFGRINKTPMKLKSGLVTEWTTSAELEEVIQDSTKYELQSFLVQLRILSSKKWRAIDHFLYQAVNCGGCCRKLKEQKRFIELLDILWVILEVIRRFDPLEPGLWDHVTENVVEYLVWTLSDLMERGDPLMTIDTIETSLELILATHQPKPSNADSNMETLLKLISLLAIRPQLVNDTVKDMLSDLVGRERRGDRGRTLLHMACKDERNVHQFSTVHLLLEVGADRDAGDMKGNGPLHVVARSDNNLIAELLLDFGAHLDRVNKEGQTAVDLWLEYNAGYEGCSLKDFREEDGSWSDELPEWCREVVPKLSCLSARIIRSEKVPYLKKLPPSLCSFVEMH